MPLWAGLMGQSGEGGRRHLDVYVFMGVLWEKEEAPPTKPSWGPHRAVSLLRPSAAGEISGWKFQNAGAKRAGPPYRFLQGCGSS